ncbi:hypothetical protein FQZ97_1195820 [compost metagenome]
MDVLQAALEGRQAFVELLEITLELTLADIGDRQHQHGKVIQHRHQLIHIQPGLNALAQQAGLILVALGQWQFGQQAEQGRLDMTGNRAVPRLGHRRQGVLGIGQRTIRLLRLSGRRRRLGCAQ